MNIFVLDSNPQRAATQQLDKHVVKMPLESAQMLCSALITHGTENTPYRNAHPKHPCTVWAAKTRSNFRWLVAHGIALSEEYRKRYGRRHKSQDVIEWCASQATAIPNGTLTTFAQAMPEQYRNTDAVTAYRQYYMGEKREIATWKQNRPEWFV